MSIKTADQLLSDFANNSAGQITPALLRDFVSSIYLRAKFLQATVTIDSVGPVHMKQDEDLASLQALQPLDSETATQDDVNARLNLMKASYIAHALGVGSPTVDGEHYAQDTDTHDYLAGYPDATDLPSAITLIGDSSNGFGQAIFDHGSDAGHHFHTDSSYGGNAFAFTGVSPPVSLGDCCVAANDILTSIITHYTDASF